MKDAREQLLGFFKHIERTCIKNNNKEGLKMVREEINKLENTS